MASEVSTVLTAMLGWINQVLVALMENADLKFLLVLPIVAAIISIVISVIKSLWNS